MSESNPSPLTHHPQPPTPPIKRNHPGRLCSDWLPHRPRPQGKLLAFNQTLMEHNQKNEERVTELEKLSRRQRRGQGLEVKVQTESGGGEGRAWSSQMLQTQEKWNCSMCSQSMFCGPAAWASPGNLFQKQMFSLQPRPVESELWGGAQHSAFKSPSGISADCYHLRVTGLINY